MPKYRHSHIVTAGYLRTGWAVDELVPVRWTDGSPARILPVKVAGVRSDFYREQLPDGSTRDRLEPAMSKLEGKALGIIRQVEDCWPLADPQRATLAEFVALQLMRSPAWRDWYAGAVEDAHRHVRDSGASHGEQQLKAARELAATDSERHSCIVRNLAPMGSMMANMRWTLLRCGSPRLVTSDHPVVPVRVGPNRITPLDPVPVGGVLGAYEFRFALTARLLLVLTWADEFDAESVAKARIEQVRNHNATVIEIADKQWFHHRERVPERMCGPWPPLAESIHEGYNARGVRWQIVRNLIDQMDADADEDPGASIRLVQWDSPRVERSA